MQSPSLVVQVPDTAHTSALRQSLPCRTQRPPANEQCPRVLQSAERSQSCGVCATHSSPFAWHRPSREQASERAQPCSLITQVPALASQIPASRQRLVCRHDCPLAAHRWPPLSSRVTTHCPCSLQSVEALQ